MLEPVGIDMGDAVGAVIGALGVGVEALDVGWTDDPTDEVDGVLEHAAARPASARTGSSKEVRWRLMAVSRVKGEGSEQVGVGDHVVFVVAGEGVKPAPARDQA